MTLRQQHDALCKEHGALAIKQVLGTITDAEGVRLAWLRAEFDVIESAIEALAEER